MKVRTGWFVVALGAVACSANQGREAEFEALQARGEAAMGVNQYTSTHRFDDLADGGRIELQRDTADPRDVATIRRHLREVMAGFERGNFTTPAFVHAQEVPGTAIMSARRALLQYEYRDLPQGGEIRISTKDPEALRAVHQFLAFQRRDHRASGHSH